MSLDAARAVADAVLYEGYLLYPYRATSSKNQVRWQFGVLGPRGAEAAGTGEASGLSMQCLLKTTDPGDARVRIHVRFLQVQRRRTQRATDDAGAELVDVPELTVGSARWLAWDEAVEVERSVEVSLDELRQGTSSAVDVHPGEDIEDVMDDTGAVAGRLIRQRWHVQATVSARAELVGDVWRLTVDVENQGPAREPDKDDALRRSLVGTHLLLEASGAATGFVSVIDPPDEARSAAAGCQQRRCWPVLAGPEGDDSLVLGSPIILYDHPEIANESAGALFDSTEIDEILTLRVMTMTDEEKAEARATDPRAAEIIDRCDQMSPEQLQRLHGVLRDPHGADRYSPDLFSDEKPWWDPDSEAAVDPQLDHVLVQGVRVAKDSLVR
ncbi:MAG: hypothetical protein ABJA81_06275, partial [Nocardioidaceae bacterium]